MPNFTAGRRFHRKDNVFDYSIAVPRLWAFMGACYASHAIEFLSSLDCDWCAQWSHADLNHIWVHVRKVKTRGRCHAKQADNRPECKKESLGSVGQK
jgi:hypothetical protein